MFEYQGNRASSTQDSQPYLSTDDYQSRVSAYGRPVGSGTHPSSPQEYAQNKQNSGGIPQLPFIDEANAGQLQHNDTSSFPEFTESYEKSQRDHDNPAYDDFAQNGPIRNAEDSADNEGVVYAYPNPSAHGSRIDKYQSRPFEGAKQSSWIQPCSTEQTTHDDQYYDDIGNRILSFRTSVPGQNNSNWYDPGARRKRLNTKRRSSKSNVENDQNVRNVQRKRSSVLNNKNKKEGKNASLKGTKHRSYSSSKHKGKQNSKNKGFNKTRQSRDGMKQPDAAEIPSKGKARKVQKDCSQASKISSGARWLRFHRPKSQNLNLSQTPTGSAKQRRDSNGKVVRSGSRKRSWRPGSGLRASGLRSSSRSKSPNEHVDLSNYKRKIRMLCFHNSQSLPDHVQEQIISNRSTTESTKLQQFHSIQTGKGNISAEKLQQEVGARQQDLLQTRTQLFEANFKIKALKKKLKESREAKEAKGPRESRDNENVGQMATEPPMGVPSPESVQQMIGETRKEDQQKIATLQNEVTSLKCYLSSYLSERQKASEVSPSFDQRKDSQETLAQVQTSQPYLSSFNDNSTQRKQLKTTGSILTSTGQSQTLPGQEDRLSIRNQMSQFENYTHISNQINNRNIVIQRQYAELLHKIKHTYGPTYQNDANQNARNVINESGPQRESSTNSNYLLERSDLAWVPRKGQLSQDRSNDVHKYESQYGQRRLSVGDSICGQPQEVLKYINELELLMQQQSNNLIDLQQYHQIHKDNISNRPSACKCAQHKNTYHLHEGGVYDEDQNLYEKAVGDPKRQQRAITDGCLSCREPSVQYIGQEHVSSDVTVGMINGQQKEQQAYTSTIQSLRKDGDVQNNQFQILNSRVGVFNGSGPGERPSGGRSATGGFEQQSNENFLDQANDRAHEFEMNPQQIQLHDHNVFYRQSSERHLPINQSIDKFQTTKRQVDSAVIIRTAKSNKQDSTQQNIEQYSTYSEQMQIGAKRQSTTNTHDQNEYIATNGFVQYLLSEIQNLKNNTGTVIQQNQELQNENAKLKEQQQIDTLLKSIAAAQQFHRADDGGGSKARNMHPNLKNEPLSQIQPGLAQSPQISEVRHQLNKLVPVEVTNSMLTESSHLKTQSDKQQEQLVNKLKEYEDIFSFMKQQITTLEGQVNQERSEKGPRPGDAGAQQSAGRQAGHSKPDVPDATTTAYIDESSSQSSQQSKRVNQEAMDQHQVLSARDPNGLPSPIRCHSTTENLQKYDELLDLNSSISRKLKSLRRLSNDHNSKTTGTNNSKNFDEPATEDIQMNQYNIVESKDDQCIQQTTQTYADGKHVREFIHSGAYEQDSGPPINGGLIVQRAREHYHRQSQGNPAENERIQELEERLGSSVKRLGPQRDLLDEQLDESSYPHSLIKQIQGASRETPPQADADGAQMRNYNNLIYTESSATDGIEVADGVVGKVNGRDTNKSPQFRAETARPEQRGSKQSDRHGGQVNESHISRYSVPRSVKSSHYPHQMSKNGNPELSSQYLNNTTSNGRQDLSNYRSSKLSSDHLEYLRNQQESNQNQPFILVQDSHAWDQSYLQALSCTHQTKSFQSTKSISEFNAQNYHGPRMDRASQRSALISEVEELMMLNHGNLQDGGLNRGQAILKTTDERRARRRPFIGDQTPNETSAHMPNTSCQVGRGDGPLVMEGEAQMFGSLTDQTGRGRSQSTHEYVYHGEGQGDRSSGNMFKDHHEQVEEIQETPKERTSESNRSPEQVATRSRRTQNDQPQPESLSSLMSERTKNLRQEISSLDQEIIDLQNSLNRAINTKKESN